jgi:beta-glucosidase
VASGETSRSAVAFPPGFVWGTATAAYQIEGGVDEDGRGPSIWDTYSHRRGMTHNGDTGDVACDHYHRVEGDLDLLAELGAGSYRFSVAWPRVQPTGKGPANQPGLDFYRRLVDGLRDRDIAPAVTLYHWDLPQALEDAGGWTVRDTAERYAEYVSMVASALGLDVALWTTLNEPWCSAWLGYGVGSHAPGRTDVGAAVAATHHLLLAHGLGVEAVRAAAGPVPVGITLNLTPVRPATDHPDDRAAAHRVDGNQNRIFTDPIFRGRYPEDMLTYYPDLAAGGPLVLDGDLEQISVPIDFLGINFYYPKRAGAAGRSGVASSPELYLPYSPDPVVKHLGAVDVARGDVAHTSMDWEIDPDSLRELLVGLRDEYGTFPIYVSENGAAFSDYVDPTGLVRDQDRIDYLEGHLRALGAALTAGVDVRGYYLWSFLDNFEWARGYQRRFGLVWVDYGTQQRLPKASFGWYRNIVRANSLPSGPA